MIPTRIRNMLESLENFKDEKTQFHPEPNVRNHLGQCATMAINKGFDFTTVYATMLHDIGKNTTNKEEWIQHANRGARMIAPDVTEQITWLVANHMKMYDLDKMSQDKQEKLKAHPYYTHLSILHDIDKKCRKEDGKHMPWEDIFAHINKVDGRINTVALMIGIQASGKTTISNVVIKNAGLLSYNRPMGFRTSRDDLRVIFGVGADGWRHQENIVVKTQQDQIRMALGRGQFVMVDNCHNTVVRRRDMITWLRSEFPGIKIKAIFVYAPLDICLKRNREEHGKPHRHKILIPDEVIKQFYSDLISGLGVKDIESNKDKIEKKLLDEGFNYVEFVPTS